MNRRGLRGLRVKDDFGDKTIGQFPGIDLVGPGRYGLTERLHFLRADFRGCGDNLADLLNQLFILLQVRGSGPTGPATFQGLRVAIFMVVWRGAGSGRAFLSFFMWFYEQITG